MMYFKVYDPVECKVYESDSDSLYLLSNGFDPKRCFRYDLATKEMVEISAVNLLWGTKISGRLIYDHDLYAIGDLRFEVQFIKENNGFYLLDLGTGVTTSLTNTLFTTLLVTGIKYVGTSLPLV